MNEQKEESIKDIMKERLRGMLRRPAIEQREKRPFNKLPLAWIGFNVIMAFLDLISAITVALLTNVLYGVLTFLAGFLALLLHETLFTNAYSSTHQKWIAVGGALLAIVSTVAIGVLAGLANVFNLAELVSTQSIEVGMIIGLVCVAGVHGCLWGIYFFTDAGHISLMKAMANAAYRDQQKQDFEDAKRDLRAVKVLDGELKGMGDEADLIEEAYRENTGRELVQRSGIPADPRMPFLQKSASVEKPAAGDATFHRQD